MTSFNTLKPGDEQLGMMNAFINQQMEACCAAGPEEAVVFGDPERVGCSNFLHPLPESLIGMCLRLDPKDGKSWTVFILPPHPELSPFIMKGTDLEGGHSTWGVWFCPEAILVARPTEPDDLREIGGTVQ